MALAALSALRPATVVAESRLDARTLRPRTVDLVPAHDELGVHGDTVRRPKLQPNPRDCV